MVTLVWHFSAGHRKLFYGFIALSALANVISLLQPLVLGRIFNSIQFATNDPKLVKYIILNLLFLVGIDFGFWLFHGPSRVIERKNAFLARRNYRNRLFKQVLALPPQWHKDHHSGDTIDKVEKASRELYHFGSSMFQVVQNIVNLVGSFAILAFFDWRASLVALLVSTVAIYTNVNYDRKLQKGYKKIFKAENFLSAGIFDYLSNIMTVITLRLRRKAANEIDKRSMVAYKTFKHNAALTEWKWFLTTMFISIMIFGVISYNAYANYVAGGVIMVGTLYILYGYLNRIGRTFYAFAWMYGEIVRQDTALLAVEVITKEYDNLPHKNRTEKLRSDWESIGIRDLNFNYPEEGTGQKRAGKLDKVDVDIKRGSRIAFVGESGSGKSTIFSVLRGLHKPDSARVLINGEESKEGLIPIHNQVTLIPQEPELFNATIRENITMGFSTSNERVEEAVEMARFRRVVERLRKGYETNVLEKGVSLSGGEKQRLALARGLLAAHDSDILILDEPTSSVDSMNEMRIYDNIFKFFPRKTLLSAIHRLHLLPRFDYIYILKDGRVSVHGTFRQILENKEFKAIWDEYNSKSGSQ